jgi:hypothetical protein
MRFRRIAVLAVVALGAGATSSSAHAQGPANPFKAVPTAHFEGTNGYDVTVYGSRDSIVLFADQPNYRVSVLTGDAETGRKRLVGAFGDAGSIKMKFHGRGEPRAHTIRGCEGEYQLRRGIWKGEMRFAGKGGFTSVFATEAPGRTVTSVDLECGPDGGGGGGEPSPPRHGFFLDVVRGNPYDSDRGGNGTALQVNWLNGRKRAHVQARVRETDGPVETSYEGFTSAPRDRVHLSVKRGRARVDPGYPFVGAAKYRASREDVNITHGVPVGAVGPFWEGNLAVVLPGLGAVPLTGPRFRASVGGLTVTTLRPLERTFGVLERPFAGFAAN